MDIAKLLSNDSCIITEFIEHRFPNKEVDPLSYYVAGCGLYLGLTTPNGRHDKVSSDVFTKVETIYKKVAEQYSFQYYVSLGKYVAKNNILPKGIILPTYCKKVVGQYCQDEEVFKHLVTTYPGCLSLTIGNLQGSKFTGIVDAVNTLEEFVNIIENVRDPFVCRY